MNNTQNQKIAQITDKTLIVGVDIGGEKHFARAILARGFEVSKKPFPFMSTEDGFDSFVSWAYNLANSHKLTKIMIAMEPTGHYWFTFAAFLKRYDVQVVLVAPQHVKHSKEMDDNTQEKDDRKDPIVIARLVPEGRYLIPYIPKDVYAELRAAFNRRCELVEEQVRIANRMIRWFDIYFPEYRKVYGRIDAKTGIMILKRAPLPADILGIGVDGICQIWKDAKVRGYGPKKAKQLFTAAEHSVGMKGGASVRWNLWQLLEEYELVERQLNDILQLIEGCLYQISGADKLLKVPGAGLITVAGFLSEVGDIKRFSDSKQIQKLAGLAVVENSSGKRKGLPGISKRGRSRLRWVLFQLARSMVMFNPEMKAYHQYYTTRKDNPLKKLQSLIAIAARIARIFYGMLKSGTEYDPTMVMKDYNKAVAA